MSEYELRRAVRHTRKANRLGLAATCAQCGEHDIRVLRRVGKLILCADCHLESQGKSSFELHHIAGKTNDEFCIPIPGNAHAILSDAQYDWPWETLSNPDRDPLREFAAWFRGIHDLLIHLAEWLLNWATRLEALSKFLENVIGANWPSKIEGWMDVDEEK